MDGQHVIRDMVSGSVDEAEALGVALAERILDAGGDTILNDIYGRA